MSLMHPWGVQGRNPELRSPVNVAGDGDGNDDDIDDFDDDDDDDDGDDDDCGDDVWYVIVHGGRWEDKQPKIWDFEEKQVLSSNIIIRPFGVWCTGLYYFQNSIFL